MDQRLPTKPGLGRAPAFWLLVYVSVLLFTGTTIPTPLYQVYQQEMQFSSGTLTLIFAVYVLTLLPTLLLFGHVSDAIGRRPVLLVGLAFAAGALIVFATARGVPSLFLARALQGVATGSISGALTAALAELEPRRDLKRAAFILTTANVGGAALGPIFGGLLAQYGPFPTRLPYLACLVLMAPVIAVAALPETVAFRHPLSLRLRIPEVPRDIRREFMLAGATSFTAWAATALFLTLAPSYVATLLELRNLAIGGGVVFLMLATSAVAQTLLRGLPFRTTMTAGLLMLPIGLAGFVLAVPLRSAPLLAAATLTAGAGQGLAFMGALALVNAIAPARRRADIASSFFLVTYLGVAIPVIGVGFGAQWAGLFAAVCVFAVVVGAVALALAWSVRRRASGEWRVVSGE
ncbi:MAG: MFS transporter [Alphaproteobacteria bacterium]